MHQLQDLFDKQFQDQLKLHVFLANVIEGELSKRDIHLTAEQKKQLVSELDNVKII